MFLQSQTHDTNGCNHLKDVIEELIIKGWLTRYTREWGIIDDRDRKKYHMGQDESPNKKQPSLLEKKSLKKTIEVVNKANGKKVSSSEEKEDLLGKL